MIWGRVQGPIGTRYTGYANAFATTGEAKLGNSCSTVVKTMVQKVCTIQQLSGWYFWTSSDVSLNMSKYLDPQICHSWFDDAAICFANCIAHSTRPTGPTVPALGRESWGPTKGHHSGDVWHDVPTWQPQPIGLNFPCINMRMFDPRWNDCGHRVRGNLADLAVSPCWSCWQGACPRKSWGS